MLPSVCLQNGNGFLTLAECRLALGNIGEKLSETELNQMLSFAKPDHRGLVDLAEFIKTINDL